MFLYYISDVAVRLRAVRHHHGGDGERHLLLGFEEKNRLLETRRKQSQLGRPHHQTLDQRQGTMINEFTIDVFHSFLNVMLLLVCLTQSTLLSIFALLRLVVS